VPGHRSVSKAFALMVIGLAASAGFANPTGRTAHAGTSTAGTPGFGQPTPSGVEGDGFEQDLALDDTTPGAHIVYTSAPVGVATGISNVWRSLDGGQTFKFVPATIAPEAGGHPTTCPAGGGDSELAVDSAGNLYFADLYLGNFSVARSDANTHGTSFAPTPSCTGVPDAGVDRQWYTALGDPTNGGALFLVYDRLDQSNGVQCPANPTPQIPGNALVIARSPAFGQLGPTAGNQFGASLALSCDEAIMGNDASFDYTHVKTGGGPEVFVIHDNKALNNITLNRCDVVAESALNPIGLTNCAEHLVASFPGFVTGANFPTMAIDNQGNLFAVWEQAPGSKKAATGNTQLYFATSSDEGNTWTSGALSTTPGAHLPTPGLAQDVMAWPAAGDPGRFDVAFYGAPEPWVTGDSNGPDSVIGHYGLYMVQTLNNGATWSPQPISAGEHFVHYGSQYTLIGGQTGNRDSGDFLKMKIGPQGEANISYSDDNNLDYGGLNPQAFFVRQNSGPGLYASKNFGAGAGQVNLPAAPTGNCVTDNEKTGDATFDTANAVGPDNPNLEITQVCMSVADAANYQATLQVQDLTSLGPDATAGGSTNIWQVQWHVPSSSDPFGGALFMVYAESVAGGAVTCWAGQAAQENAEISYPGTIQLPANDCQVTQGAPGKIKITIPIADVSEQNPIGNTLYAVTASSQTLTGNAETPAPNNVNGYAGGQLPNVIDVVPSLDVALPATNIPELPWVPPLVVVGGLTAVLALRRTSGGRRRRLASSGGTDA